MTKTSLYIASKTVLGADFGEKDTKVYVVSGSVAGESIEPIGCDTFKGAEKVCVILKKGLIGLKLFKKNVKSGGSSLKTWCADKGISLERLVKILGGGEVGATTAEYKQVFDILLRG